MPRVRRVLFVAILALMGGTAGRSPAADSGEPVDLIPAESLVAWSGLPYPDLAPPSDQPSTIATVVDLGTRLAGGRLDDQGKLLLRGVELFNLVIRYPYAFALIDTEARPAGPDGEARRGEKQQLVLVVKTNGESERFLGVIQKAVNELVSRHTARLERKSAGEFSYQELTDSRMPDWFSVAWGDIGEHFVLTVGPEVWPRIARVAGGEAASLSRDPWYAEARRQRRGQALIELFINGTAARERLDPFIDGRATQILKIWGIGELEHSHWAFGFEGRGLFCEAHFQQDGRTWRRLFADPRTKNEYLLKTIPDTARYAIYRVPVGKVLDGFFTSLQRTRSESAQQEVATAWEQAKDEFKFDPERDLLPNLGEYAVFHNDPPHPLRLPLAMTMLIEIRSNPGAVRECYQRMCRAAQIGLQRAYEADPTPLALSLHYDDDDGIWYFQLGPFAGPAWVITDRFIVSSWSPPALRTYLGKIGDAVGQVQR